MLSAEAGEAVKSLRGRRPEACFLYREQGWNYSRTCAIKAGRRPAAAGDRAKGFANSPSISYIKLPIDWIASNSRDPNIYTNPPQSDDVFSESSLVCACRCSSLGLSWRVGDGSRARRRDGFAGDPRLHVPVLLQSSARFSAPPGRLDARTAQSRRRAVDGRSCASRVIRHHRFWLAR
jgi:hypothetical protein